MKNNDENGMTPINTLSGQNAEVFQFKAGRTYSYHCVLKSKLKIVITIVKWGEGRGGEKPAGPTPEDHPSSVVGNDV